MLRRRRASGGGEEGIVDAAMTGLPEPVAELATMLAAMPGAVAVALGGSRALGVGRVPARVDVLHTICSYATNPQRVRVG
jgi:hypothetical protein